MKQLIDELKCRWVITGDGIARLSLGGLKGNLKLKATVDSLGGLKV